MYSAAYFMVYIRKEMQYLLQSVSHTVYNIEIICYKYWMLRINQC